MAAAADRRHTRILEWVLITSAPVLTWILLRFNLINQEQTIDPWIYTGYGRAFPVLHAQFGWPYYAVRFPVIALNEVASLLPPVVGYAVLRYVLLLGCGVPLYLWARKQFGVGVAVVCYLFLFWNPLLPRILLWDLTTFVSVPAALAGMALWLLCDNGSWPTRAGAGALWLISIASHPFTGSAIGLFVLAQSIRRIRNREFSHLVKTDFLPATAAAVVCLLLGLVYYWLRIGTFDPMTLLTVTLRAVSAGNSYAGTHRTPVLTWATREYHVYVPMLCVLLVAILRRRRLMDNSAVTAVWWFAAAYTGVYLVYQLLFGRFVLETFYYFAHLATVVFLLLPVVLFELATITTSRPGVPVFGAATLALVSVPLLNRLAPASAESFVKAATGNVPIAALLIATGLVLAASTLWLTRRRLGTIATGAAFILLIQVLTFLNPYHQAVFDARREARQTDLYVAALSLLDVFASYARPATPVMLWFCEHQVTVQAIASSVQLYTLHQPFTDGRDACDSKLGKYERDRLQQKRSLYVMMLDDTGQSFAAREASLSDEGYATREIVARTIGGPAYHTALRLIQIEQVGLSKDAREVLQLPSTQLVHWATEDLRTVGMPVMYADHPVRALSPTQDGSWAFNPATNQDHFATPYIPLTSSASTRSVAVLVKPSQTAGANCVLYVQNEKYDTIGRVPCGHDEAKNGLPVVISVPPSATAIRMFVADPQLTPIVLPQEVTVTLYARGLSNASPTP